MSSLRAMRENTIRWGMIGCGAVTEVKSGPAFASAPGSSLVAVTSRTVSRAHDYAARHNVPLVFEQVGDLISSPDVDAVYIATPPRSHKKLALQVAAAGKPCCVEKPMALDYAECMSMVEAFAARDVPLFVSYYRRSLPRFTQVKDWLAQDAIGPVRELRWHLSKPASQIDLSGKPNWRTDPAESPGGYFSDLASHGIDLFQFLLGDIDEARGLAANQQGLYRAEDAVSASWKFASGALGSGSWNFGAERREDEVQIVGAKGKIVFSVFDEVPLRLFARGSESSTYIENPRHIQLCHVENLINQLRDGVAHPSPAYEAAKTSRIMDAILASR
jgi:1,5-anhydro-D-fructose reductase (1,5-anhydro-D-mannitol-forming)